MSSDITRVGPPDENDFPPKRNGLLERIWRDSWYCHLAARTWGLFFLYGRGSKIDEIERGRDEPLPADQPWHGLPEAELTDEQRREAMERLSRE